MLEERGMLSLQRRWNHGIDVASGVLQVEEINKVLDGTGVWIADEE